VAIQTTLLPDDPVRLRRELESARQHGADVIFTTGGTGVGPRDISPEVAVQFCEKLIPGIMDHVRLKFGAHNPGALLSRSVAGITGTTQLYTLPGSVRAVEEYMGEILKIVEHLIYCLHGIDRH
jgi:molybdopterin adenylyltransferase